MAASLADPNANTLPTPTSNTVSTGGSREHSASGRSKGPPISKTGIPEQNEIEEKTDREEAQPFIRYGEDTEELSDISDDADQQSNTRTTRKNKWYRRYAPFFRNKQIMYMAISNLVLLLVNILFFIALFLLVVFAVQKVILWKESSLIYRPCYYEWSEWSECSATCRTNESVLNYKRRHVIADSILKANGGAPECRPDLTSTIDVAPCNTNICPKSLSDYEFSEYCYHVEAHNISSPCIQVRNIPKGDLTVVIDGRLTQACTCSDQAP